MTIAHPHPRTRVRSHDSVDGRLAEWVGGHPLTAFFAGAFLFSWILWTPAMVGLEGAVVTAVFFVGVLGPMASAAAVVHLGGGSSREWLRSIFHLRFDKRWFAFALGVPFGIAAVASTGFAAAGESLDFGLVAERLAMIVPLLVVTFLANGGPEEPGWRGFALPRLQDRFTPVVATLVLGALWALWHLPLIAIEDDADHGLGAWGFAGIMALTFVGIVLYAFPYTYLWNRTRSAVTAMALHAGFNTSLAVVILREDDELVEGTYVTLLACQTIVLLAVAVGLVMATKGRLGRDTQGADSALQEQRSG